MPINRKTTLGPLVVLSLILTACGGGSSASPGGDSAAAGASCDLTKLGAMSPADRDKTILEGAKKEGKVLVYSSINQDVLTEWQKEFNAKYPDVKFEGLNLNTQDNRERTLTEERAGRHQMDVNINGGAELNAMKVENFLAENPGKVGIPEGMDEKFYGTWWGANEILPTLITWNTDKVAAADAPKSYEELLDPKWKGKVSFDAAPTEFISGMLLPDAWGYDKTKAFVTNLVANDAQIRVGHSNQAQLLAAGEFSISTELFGYRVERLRADGAPLDWIAGNPTPAITTSSAVSANAPHPCAAALAFEYLMSEDGSKQVAKAGRTPTHPAVDGIFPRLNELEKSPNLKVATPDDVTGELFKQAEEIEAISASHTKK